MTKLIEAIRNCKNCKLFNNQLPLVEFCNDAEIFWVGLSAVKTSVNSEIPLSPNTNSGKLIKSIEYFLPSITFYKTNVVKCLPLENGKIRYPCLSEMKNCYSHLKAEIDFLKPKVVFLLGKQVATFVLKEYGLRDISLNEYFNYSTYCFEETIYIPIHHPSFILVYKRKKLSDYMGSIADIIENKREPNKTIRNIGYSQWMEKQIIKELKPEPEFM
jgi:uracil-DNA glycosylase